MFEWIKSNNKSEFIWGIHCVVKDNPFPPVETYVRGVAAVARVIVRLRDVWAGSLNDENPGTHWGRGEKFRKYGAKLVAEFKKSARSTHDLSGIIRRFERSRSSFLSSAFFPWPFPTFPAGSTKFSTNQNLLMDLCSQSTVVRASWSSLNFQVKMVLTFCRLHPNLSWLRMVSRAP